MASEAKAATETDRAIGMRLTAIRKAKGISQTQLGAAVGVTFQQIQKYEKGTNRIGSGRLQQMADFLDIKVSTLFEDETTDEGAKTSEFFTFLAIPGAVELLRHYAGLEDRQSRQDVLDLVRRAANLGKSPLATEAVAEEAAPEATPAPVAAESKPRGRRALAGRAVA